MHSSTQFSGDFDDLNGLADHTSQLIFDEISKVTNRRNRQQRTTTSSTPSKIPRRNTVIHAPLAGLAERKDSWGSRNPYLQVQAPAAAAMKKKAASPRGYGTVPPRTTVPSSLGHRDDVPPPAKKKLGKKPPKLNLESANKRSSNIQAEITRNEPTTNKHRNPATASLSLALPQATLTEPCTPALSELHLDSEDIETCSAELKEILSSMKRPSRRPSTSRASERTYPTPLPSPPPSPPSENLRAEITSPFNAANLFSAKPSPAPSNFSFLQALTLPTDTSMYRPRSEPPTPSTIPPSPPETVIEDNYSSALDTEAESRRALLPSSPTSSRRLQSLDRYAFLKNSSPDEFSLRGRPRFRRPFHTNNNNNTNTSALHGTAFDLNSPTSNSSFSAGPAPSILSPTTVYPADSVPETPLTGLAPPIGVSGYLDEIKELHDRHFLSPSRGSWGAGNDNIRYENDEEEGDESASPCTRFARSPSPLARPPEGAEEGDAEVTEFELTDIEAEEEEGDNSDVLSLVRNLISEMQREVQLREVRSDLHDLIPVIDRRGSLASLTSSAVYESQSEFITDVEDGDDGFGDGSGSGTLVEEERWEGRVRDMEEFESVLCGLEGLVYGWRSGVERAGVPSLNQEEELEERGVEVEALQQRVVDDEEEKEVRRQEEDEEYIDSPPPLSDPATFRSEHPLSFLPPSPPRTPPLAAVAPAEMRTELEAEIMTEDSLPVIGVSLVEGEEGKAEVFVEDDDVERLVREINEVLEAKEGIDARTITNLAHNFITTISIHLEQNSQILSPLLTLASPLSALFHKTHNLLPPPPTPTASTQPLKSQLSALQADLTALTLTLPLPSSERVVDALASRAKLRILSLLLTQISTSNSPTPSPPPSAPKKKAVSSFLTTSATCLSAAASKLLFLNPTSLSSSLRFTSNNLNFLNSAASGLAPTRTLASTTSYLGSTTTTAALMSTSPGAIFSSFSSSSAAVVPTATTTIQNMIGSAAGRIGIESITAASGFGSGGLAVGLGVAGVAAVGILAGLGGRGRGDDGKKEEKEREEGLGEVLEGGLRGLMELGEGRVEGVREWVEGLMVGL